MHLNPTKILLKSGESFRGFSPSWQKKSVFGEVVFTTGMTGYVESLTDPSFAGQILVFTYPLIGNYGVPDPSQWESKKIQVAGVAIAEASLWASHYDSKNSFLEWLEQEKVPLITGVDTRALTKTLRMNGAQLGTICSEKHAPPKEFYDPNKTHLVQSVTIPQRKISGTGPKTVVVVDCGIKENSLRLLSRYPLRIIRVPYDEDYTEEDYDGLLISNGPGDPKVCKETIAILKKALSKKKPLFGICMGAQLIAISIGASTYKLKFGHRGHNHPCRDEARSRCILTAQNHGYAIDEKSLPDDWVVSFRSMNDGSVEGIAHKTLPYFAVQFHPESAPGPNDSSYLFDQFIRSL